jgi:plastocyanin
MRLISLTLPVIAFAVVACGGGGGDPGGINPPPSNLPVSTITLNKSSANIRISEGTNFGAILKDANGTTLSGRTVTWQASPANIVDIVPAANGSATVKGLVVGTTSLTATSESKTSGSATITVTNDPFPSVANVIIGDQGGSTFSPDRSEIASGGQVTWNYASGSVTHNVTFDPANPVTIANIPDNASGSFARSFNSAGTYNYRCTIHAGMSGVVVVH